MVNFINSSSWIVSSCLIVAASIVICLLILWFLRKIISIHELRKNHDVVGFTFSIVGVLYSVILGFTVINVQNRYNAVQESIHTEAILLADLYEDAGFFSDKDAKAIRSSLRLYIDHVIKEEWWLIGAKKLHLKTRSIIHNIWDAYYNIDLENEKEKIWYSESISKLDNFLNSRLTRQFHKWEHLGAMMWSILLIGAVITICFMFFFGLENFRSHMLMTALLAGYLSFMLFLVYSLDNVFKGPQQIKPVALEQVRTLFDQWDKE